MIDNIFGKILFCKPTCFRQIDLFANYHFGVADYHFGIANYYFASNPKMITWQIDIMGRPFGSKMLAPQRVMVPLEPSSPEPCRAIHTGANVEVLKV